MNRELQRQITTLMSCRAILLSALLVSGLIIGRLLDQRFLGSQHYFLLIGVGYGLTILYTLVHPLWSHSRVAASVQTAGDIVLITAFVHVTGGVSSPFSLIYFLPIIAASIMLGRAGALSAASGSWVMFAFLVVLHVFGWLPGIPAAAGVAEPLALNKRVAYSLFSHFLGFFSVAHLASYLSIKLKTTGDELAANREALAEIQALNKNIIDSITSGIVTTDLRGRITFMNRGAEEITGLRFDDVEGTGIASFLGRSEGEEFVGTLSCKLEQQGRWRFESSTQRAQGGAVYLGVSSAFLRDGRGCPQGYIFSFQDLTEIKALEEEVSLNERMAALGEMAAGIAHEIRNPLASMSGSAQILKKGLDTDGEEGELLDIVVRESRRLDRIIGNFLMFARPRPFRPEPVDIVPILNESLTLLGNSEEFTPRHRMNTEFTPASVEALVDTDLIKQVFWNLAKNAVKAMPEGGAVTVRARYEGDSIVRISFTDQGVGMDESEIQHVFEPFHSRFREGTGLGLAVAFRIVEQHRGRIRVKSRRGEGTEVVLTLPAAEQHPRMTATEIAS